MTQQNEKTTKQNTKSNRLLIVLSIIALICLIFCIVSNCYICSVYNFKKEITIAKNGTTIDSMEIKALSLHPGESVDYQVVLNSKVSGTYEVTFEFNEKLDGGLKEFIIVTINDGDKNILNKGLSNVFEDGKVTFNCNIVANKPYVIDVSYLMPEDVDNNAMGTTANFQINFNIVLVLS